MFKILSFLIAAATVIAGAYAVYRRFRNAVGPPQAQAAKPRMASARDLVWGCLVFAGASAAAALLSACGRDNSCRTTGWTWIGLALAAAFLTAALIVHVRHRRATMPDKGKR